jgi:hypothetical protein
VYTLGQYQPHRVYDRFLRPQTTIDQTSTFMMIVMMLSSSIVIVAQYRDNAQLLVVRIF